MSHDIFLMLYYAGGVGLFVLMLVPLVLVGFLVFSMLPSMLFSRFYDRLYKRLGFMPEITLFLVCCGLSATLTVTVMQSPPLCPDPLHPHQPQRLTVYTGRDNGPIPLRLTPTGGVAGMLPPGTRLYAQTLPNADTATPFAVVRADVPSHPRPMTLQGFVAPTQVTPVRFLQQPMALMAERCRPLFMTDPKSLLHWPW